MTPRMIGGAAVAFTGAASAQCFSFSPEIIYTEIPGHPTASAPGVGIDFTGMLSLYTSPNGQNWIFKAFIDDPENDVIVAGSGSTGTVVAREDEPTAIPGAVHEFFDTTAGINDAGQYAYGSRLFGPPDELDEAIFFFDGASEAVAVREGDPAPGLFDPDLPGDEIYGNALNSIHVLADGRVAFQADLIDNIPIDYESALYHADAVQSQEGTSASTGEPIDGYVSLGTNAFSSSADGSVWAVEADILPGLGTEQAVLVSNEVVLVQGQTLSSAPLPVDAVFAVDVDDAGNWFARGDFTDDTDWVVRNGFVIAMTGMPITPGSTETWGDRIVSANGLGDSYAVAGNTSAGDEVIVIDNQTVVARTGDLLDLDASTQVVLESFSTEDLALREDGSVLAFVTLADSGAGAGLGDAFVIWNAAGGCNAADIAEPCGVLDLADVQAFVSGFLTQDPIADLADPMGVFDLADVQAFVTAFNAGCP